VSAAANEAALGLAVGDVVVYASHGIARVESQDGSAGNASTVVLACENGLRVTLPLARAHDSLRRLSGERELAKVQRTLRSSEDPAVEPWSKRFRAIRAKVSAGEVTGLAEVVRDGLRREQRRIGRGAGPIGPGERQLYLQARRLLAAEIALSRGLDADDADGWIVAQVGVG
jgi:RNA polymerase-interacting CarD/CdnL/TRCF family regulator